MKHYLQSQIQEKLITTPSIFGTKKNDEVICHRIKTELKYRGQDFFAKNGYDSLDIVLGGDHGARRFRAELRLIFRSSRNRHIDPYSTTLCVGSIDCTKDTRDIEHNFTFETHTFVSGDMAFFAVCPQRYMQLRIISVTR